MRRHDALVSGLTSLAVFLAGGFVSLLLVQQRLAGTVQQLTSVAAQAERLNVLDKLLGYLTVFLVAGVVVALLAVTAWLWQLGGPRQAPGGLRADNHGGSAHDNVT